MTPDIEKACTKCGQKFWVTGAEQEDRRRKRKVALSVDCPACRQTKAAASISSTMAVLEQARGGHHGELLAKVLPDPAKMFGDIKQLMGEASAPIHIRPRTFWEWLRNVDLYSQQIEEKLRVGQHADELLRQRLGIIHQYIETAKAMHEARQLVMAQEQKELQAQLEVLKLREEIACQQALQEERIKTRLLEEAKKQASLLADMSPAPPPPEPEDPAQQVIAEHRSQVRTRATAKQLVISDFLAEVWQIYESDLDDNEQVLRIRAVLEAYRQDFEALPRLIRRLIESVEDPERAA